MLKKQKRLQNIQANLWHLEEVQKVQAKDKARICFFVTEENHLKIDSLKRGYGWT